MKIKAAFATDNGKSFMGRHFGDAKYFDLYEINSTSSTFIKRIDNTVEEEEESEHGASEKAQGIGKILKVDGVNVTVSRIYGPNLKRIRKKFVCLIFKDIQIEEAIEIIQSNYENIKSEWEIGESRNFLKMGLG
jgi:predicted Fe-Mo cluster-binding NifX family protein